MCKEGGLDTFKNILILCPNHHKMLDYGAIEVISEDKVKIDGEVVVLSK